MMPLPEDIDTLPRVQTAEGRSLVNGGGIFPDLVIMDDTLTVVERDFLRAANEAEFPVSLRIAEFGLGVATERREAGVRPGVSDSEFQGFLDGLVAEGLASELLDDSEVREYLFWRSEMAVAQRMSDVGAEADFRTKRDPVLSEAIRLIQEASSQADLFRAVDAMSGATGSTGG